MTNTFLKTTLIAVFCAVFTTLSWSQGLMMGKFDQKDGLKDFTEGEFDKDNWLQDAMDSEFDKKKKKKKKKKKDENVWKQKIWYGAGLNLGFSAFNGQSAFGVGVSPMAGYKVLPFLSVGPRVSMAYTAQKVTGYKAFNLFDLETGAFVRVHPFLGFFIQGEIAREWTQQLYYNSSNDRVFKLTERYVTPYTGLGYNFSRGEGGWSSEISLMYNFRIANDIQTDQSPLEYRFAITWNF